MNGKPMPRQVARTVLLVGEGDAEVLLMQHLKCMFVQRGSGVVVTLKNARGKGATHVVDFAIRQSRNAAYDVKAVLLDTDTDWDDKTRAVAKKAKVHVMACEPCLEAVLLQLHKAPTDGRTTAQLKRDFVNRFGSAASTASVYSQHFSEAQVRQLWVGSPIIGDVIQLMTL